MFFKKIKFVFYTVEKNKNHKSLFEVAGVEFGGKNIPVFAGPNMVETEELILDVAKNFIELFYNNEELALKIKKMIDESQPEIIDIQDKKNQLFKELDNLLLETFHTTSVMIDEQKLVNGEEGCLCNIDLEYIDNGAKQGLIDASIITEQLKVRIRQCVENILNVILENKS